MATFKAVLFDGYGTLFEGTVENWMVFCTRIVLEQGIRMAPEAFLKAWGRHLFPLFRSDDFVTLREAHIISLERLFEDIETEGPVQRYVDMIFDHLNGAPIYPDVKPTLARLDGFQPGIVSNADLENIEGVLSVHNLRFPVVVISESAGVYKPNPRIFHEALDLLGCRPEESLDIIRDMLRQEPGNPVLLSVRSTAFLAMERYEEAIRDLNRALEENPRDPWLRIQRGMAYYRIGRQDEALEDLSYGLEEIPELPHALAARAEILISRDRYDMARDDLERAFEMEPDNPHIRIQLAYLIFREDRVDRALDIIRHPSLRDPEARERLRRYFQAHPEIWERFKGLLEEVPELRDAL